MLLDSIPLYKFLWNTLKENVQAELSKVTTTSHASLTLYSFIEV